MHRPAPILALAHVARTALLLAAGIMSSSCGVSPSSVVEAIRADDAVTGAIPDRPTFNEHVRPLLSTRCWQCHADPQCFGAPMRLATYADTQVTSEAHGVPMYRRMLERVISPNNTMPPGAPLDTWGQSLLQRWVDQGAPEGPETEPPPLPGDCNAQLPEGPAPDQVFVAHNADRTGPFEFPERDDPNSYMCFRFTVDVPVPVHITRMQPVIDNTSVVHHIALYRDRGNSPAEDGAPFLCNDQQGTVRGGWEFMYAWAWGTNGLDFPPDVGMPLEPGTRLVLQIHYYRGAGAPPLDASGIGMHTTPELRVHEAGMTAVGPTNFILTAANPFAVADCIFPVHAGGRLHDNPPIRVFAVFPHMHDRGRSIRGEHWRGPDLLGRFGEVERWSSSAQPNMLETFTVRPGDSLRVACTYTGLRGMETVTYGHRSEDEMCFQFMYTTPPIRTSDGTGLPVCPLIF